MRRRPLTFDQLRTENVGRAGEAFGPIDAWSPTDWACALAGKTGELCNFIKKARRGEFVKPREIADELADIIVYADLLAARLDIDLGEAVRAKFNEVSERRGSARRL